MNLLAQILTKILLAIGAVFGASQWGKSVAKKEQLETDAKKLMENAEISASASVDKPFGRMRRKK